MAKFNRNYVLRVATLDDGPFDLTITLPFTIEFDITRNTLSSANVCQLRIYNLSPLNRSRLRFNQFDFGKFRKIEFSAGYGNTIPVVFTGNISQAWSVREGVNFVTQIECFDGGFAFNNGIVNLEFPSGATQKTVMATIAATLPHVSLGAIGNYPGVLTRGNSYSGNSMQVLTDLSGGGAFIDAGKINILGTSEYIQSFAGPVVINSQSGLLGTPIRERSLVTFDMIFEPGLEAGQAVILESLTDSSFNGTYQIKGIKHRGVISSAVCGDAITTCTFFFNQRLVPVAPLS